LHFIKENQNGKMSSHLRIKPSAGWKRRNGMAVERKLVKRHLRTDSEIPRLVDCMSRDVFIDTGPISSMKTKRLFVLIAGVFATSAALATDVTAQLGTTGLGVHLTVPLRANLNARIGGNALSYSDTGSTTDVDYDYDLKLKTLDALIDWHPAAGTFRITTGLVYNGNEFDLVAKPRGGLSYVFGGRTYNVTEVGEVNGRIDFRKIAPYLGIGWSNAPTKSKGWGFSVDLGVMFHGKPRASLTPTGCTSAVPGLCDQFRNDVRAEEAELKEKVDDLRAYPVLRAGLNYRF
jgi:hypothetical protein